MTTYAYIQTDALGQLLVVASRDHVQGIYFADRPHAPPIPKEWKHDPKFPLILQTARELDEYLEGSRAEFSIPLNASGTPFQQKVWREIARIPFGETITYSDLATRVGAEHAVRATGTATGRNPISIVVPCHRVVGKNGSLTGYAGGVERKAHLLALEKRTSPRQCSFDTSGLFASQKS